MYNYEIHNLLKTMFIGCWFRNYLGGILMILFLWHSDINLFNNIEKLC